MVVGDTHAMVTKMTPELLEGTFIFSTTTDAELAARCLPEVLCLFRESEGVSLVLPIGTAQMFGFDCTTPMRWIRLNVYSALDAVGLTSAVARALSDCEIPCNVIAAFHHDHLFVPSAKAHQALAALQALSVADA